MVHVRRPDLCHCVGLGLPTVFSVAVCTLAVPLSLCLSALPSLCLSALCVAVPPSSILSVTVARDGHCSYLQRQRATLFLSMRLHSSALSVLLSLSLSLSLSRSLRLSGSRVPCALAGHLNRPTTRIRTSSRPLKTAQRPDDVHVAICARLCFVAAPPLPPHSDDAKGREKVREATRGEKREDKRSVERREERRQEKRRE